MLNSLGNHVRVNFAQAPHPSQTGAVADLSEFTRLCTAVHTRVQIILYRNLYICVLLFIYDSIHALTLCIFQIVQRRITINAHLYNWTKTLWGRLNCGVWCWIASYFNSRWWLASTETFPGFVDAWTDAAVRGASHIGIVSVFKKVTWVAFSPDPLPQQKVLLKLLWSDHPPILPMVTRQNNCLGNRTPHAWKITNINIVVI